MTTFRALVALFALGQAVLAADIVHDAEYYILEAQNGKRWAAEDEQLDARLAELRRKHGTPPNIVYVLWDDMTFAEIGAVLDVSPHTAASRYRYGLAKLREALRPVYDELCA